MKYRLLSVVPVIVSLCFIAGIRPSVVYAADDCAISHDDVAAIKAIQSNPNLGYLDEINQELAARKKLLSKVIACAKNDAQSLQATMNAVSVNTADESIKDQLSGKIGDAINYYNIELEKLNGSGIWGSEQIAQEVLSWRASTYAQLSSSVDNFILWSQNQSLFKTASDRMAQIAPMVSFLSQAGNSDLAGAFDDSQKSFIIAQNENISARQALAESLPPDQALAVIKQSLQSLSETYQDFFNVSDVIQKLISGGSK